MDVGDYGRLVGARVAAAPLSASGPWSLRVLPPVELFLPPVGLTIVEALNGVAAVRGFAVTPAKETFDLGDGEELDAFLRGPATTLDPLPLILLVTRYRLPLLLTAWFVELVTAREAVHRSLADQDFPLELTRDADGDIVFTTEGHQGSLDGTLHVRLDRWRLGIGDRAGLECSQAVEAVA